MFGRQFRLPIEQALLAAPSPHSAELGDLVTQLRERQFDAISEAITHQKEARRYQKEYYNRRAKDKTFEIGDLVYLYRPAVKPGNAAKLTQKWEPGYVIVGCHENGLTYDVRKPGSRKPPEKVHCNRLKPQKVSSVYRDALKAARAFGAKITFESDGPCREKGDTRSDSDEDEHLSTEDAAGLIVPRRRNRHDLELSDMTRPNSGVTSVLEALGPDSVSPSSSSSDESAESESYSDHLYETIFVSPSPVHPPEPRRSSRVRRPPSRYSP